MLRSSDELVNKIEQKILRKISVILGITTVICLSVGIAIGFLISGSKTSANEPKNFNAPEAMSMSFAEVAKRVEPAVVNIDTKSKVPDQITSKSDKPGNTQDDILEYFKRQARKPSYSVGSGFIVDKSGYILTNAHVVDDAAKITVKLQNGEEYQAKIIGVDDGEGTDLAVLKIDAGKDLPSVKLADSDTAQVGDWVLAIGSPFGLEQTVTAGIISKTNRETVSTTPFQKFIQTDAAINRGNSGGPLVNMNGEIIGVNSQIATSTGDYNGIGFALPSNQVAYVYQQILANGKVRRGYLGVSLDSVKPEFGKVYEMPDLKGAVITEIRGKEGQAAKAGLQTNDVITEFNGQPIEGHSDLISKIASSEPGKEVKLTYLREVNNKLEKQVATIVLGERPSSTRSSLPGDDTPKKLGEPQMKPAEDQKLGLKVEEFTADLAKTNNLEGQKGVIIKEIDPASFIADVKSTNDRRSINEGDVIQRINRIPVTDLKSFNEIVSKLKVGDPVVLHIVNYSRSARGAVPRIVTFTVQ